MPSRIRDRNYYFFIFWIRPQLIPAVSDLNRSDALCLCPLWALKLPSSFIKGKRCADFLYVSVMSMESCCFQEIPDFRSLCPSGVLI